jgi:hypothetical protein
MITDLYSEKDWVKTWYDHTNEVIYVKWFDFTSRVHLRKSCEMQLEAMRRFRATVIIADASEAIGVPYPQDQEWFISNLYPESLRLGLSAIISILPINLIAKSGARTWNDNGKKNGLNYIEVDNIEEAHAALQALRLAIKK